MIAVHAVVAGWLFGKRDVECFAAGSYALMSLLYVKYV
jgi:hypothetical protein